MCDRISAVNESISYLRKKVNANLKRALNAGRAARKTRAAPACGKSQFCPRMRALKSLFCLGLKVTASTWPRQKTLLSAQVCKRRCAYATVRAARMPRRETPVWGFFDGLKRREKIRAARSLTHYSAGMNLNPAKSKSHPGRNRNCTAAFPLKAPSGTLTVRTPSLPPNSTISRIVLSPIM